MLTPLTQKLYVKVEKKIILADCNFLLSRIFVLKLKLNLITRNKQLKQVPLHIAHLCVPDTEHFSSILFVITTYFFKFLTLTMILNLLFKCFYRTVT